MLNHIQDAIETEQGPMLECSLKAIRGSLSKVAYTPTHPTVKVTKCPTVYAMGYSERVSDLPYQAPLDVRTVRLAQFGNGLSSRFKSL